MDFQYTTISEANIKVFDDTLDQINALSNERQHLWRLAHRDKFSPDWWVRHDRIEAIGKELARLWNDRRVELCGPTLKPVAKPSAANRIISGILDDYRERAGIDTPSAWRVVDKSNPDHRYFSIQEGFQVNQYAQSLKKQTEKQSKHANIGARQRKKLYSASYN